MELTTSQNYSLINILHLLNKNQAVNNDFCKLNVSQPKND